MGLPAHLWSDPLGLLCLERERNGPMSIFVLGIDHGKNVCSLVGLDETGAVILLRG